MDTEKPRLCGNCQKELKVRGQTKYCSRTCSAKQCRNVPPPPILSEYIRTFECIGCNSPIVLNRNAIKSKYCSVQCQQDSKKLANYHTAQSGGTFSSDRTAKTSLLLVRGRMCEICKTKEWCGKPIDLVLDHIDGNSDNRKLENYRLLCNNCDAQTDTFKSRNKGNGRHSRRKRYADGKSY